MPPPIPTSLPATIQAGDTITWRRELADYTPGNGWTLRYTLISAVGVYSVTATPDGAAYAVTITASTSATWAAGLYTLVEYVTNGSQRITLGSSNVRVLPDLAAAIAPVDTRTHARKVLDNINAWLESKSITAGETQLGDRRLRQYEIGDLLALRDKYAAIVASEDAGGSRVNRLMVTL